MPIQNKDNIDFIFFPELHAELSPSYCDFYFTKLTVSCTPSARILYWQHQVAEQSPLENLENILKTFVVFRFVLFCF